MRPFDSLMETLHTGMLEKQPHGLLARFRRGEWHARFFALDRERLTGVVALRYWDSEALRQAQPDAPKGNFNVSAGALLDASLGGGSESDADDPPLLLLEFVEDGTVVELRALERTGATDALTAWHGSRNSFYPLRLHSQTPWRFAY